MTKIDIISGFLGAGKTTLIKKLLSEAFAGEQVVLIENEFGEIGMISIHNFSQRFAEISDKRTTDTTRIHFPNLDS